MSELIIRGLPSSIANDAWWLTESAEVSGDGDVGEGESPTRAAMAPVSIAVLVVLVLLADLLFWGHPVGVSLIVFSFGLTSAALISLRPELSRMEWALFAAIWVGSVLPLVEFLQVSSVSFLVFGHAGLLVWCATRSRGGSLLRGVLILPFTLLHFAVSRVIELAVDLPKAGVLDVKQASVRAWVLPILVGSVFVLLFVGANPVFERWVALAGQFEITAEVANRAVFWAVVAVLVLPFVLFKGFAQRLETRAIPMPKLRRLEGVLINQKSITNSLFLFNAMFLLQNISDVAILWGGAELPEGVTYASYAHSGAYPLMATSILAGLFALLSRPYTDGSRLLKALLLIWVMQNLVLVGSALMRLDLYVEVYGLTYLRVRAGIGMLLVLVGMGLLIWQVWRNKSNAWISSVFAGVFVTVLYVGSFVNFGYVIASENLSRSAERLDQYYLCEHSLDGVKALLERVETTGDKHCFGQISRSDPGPQGWRDWSFRAARLGVFHENYRLALRTPTTPHRDSSRARP